MKKKINLGGLSSEWKTQVFLRSMYTYTLLTYCRMGKIKEESSNTYVSAHGLTDRADIFLFCLYGVDLALDK